MPPPSGWRVARRPSGCRVNYLIAKTTSLIHGKDSFARQQLRIVSIPTAEHLAQSVVPRTADPCVVSSYPDCSAVFECKM